MSGEASVATARAPAGSQVEGSRASSSSAVASSSLPAATAAAAAAAASPSSPAAAGAANAAAHGSPRRAPAPLAGSNGSAAAPARAHGGVSATVRAWRERDELSLSEEPVLDEEMVEQLFMIGDEDDNSFIVQLAAAYFEQAEKTIDEMREFLDHGELRKFADIAHKLKGSSLALGAKRFGMLCSYLQLYGECRNPHDESDKDLDQEACMQHCVAWTGPGLLDENQDPIADPSVIAGVYWDSKQQLIERYGIADDL